MPRSWLHGADPARWHRDVALSPFGSGDQVDALQRTLGLNAADLVVGVPLDIAAQDAVGMRDPLVAQCGLSTLVVARAQLQRELPECCADLR
eukprot:8051324-Alexandrium_andersonii.AAC.1